MYIEPEYGIVYKCHDKYNDKFFVNIVSHEILEEPEEQNLIDYEN